MADSSTSQATPSNDVAAPTVVRLDSPDHSPVEPPTLGAVSGNAGTTPSITRPVFKMKRTGTATLPHVSPVRGPSEEPESARVISHILPPKLFATPTPAPPAPAPKSNSASDGTRKTKYATDEERRKATSIALKKRWASGRMDQVHKKRIETIRRKKEEESLLGTPGITKPSGPVGSLKHANMSSASPDRLPILSGLIDPPAHHASKRSVVSEQLARIFAHRPEATGSASPVPQPRPRSDGKKRESTRQIVLSTSSDLEMSDTSPPPAGHSLFDHSSDGQAAEQAKDEDDDEDATKDSPLPLKMATPDRPYTKWKDAKGSLKLTHGALLPGGYQLCTSTPNYPWICPIRPCRKVFIGLVQLGGHFIRAHRGARLHDNEDGTLSVRSQALLRRGHGPKQKRPAIIVSRGPADPSEPPAVEPSYPASAHRDSTIGLYDLTAVEAEDSTNANTSVTPSGQDLDQASALDEDEDAQEFWSYLQPYLVKHKGPTIPPQGWVRCLITLPRVRDLDWNEPWLATHPFTDTHPRDISALVLQMTGDPAPTPCGKCRDGKGPFRSCIMISSKAEAGPMGAILSCANCFYHFNQTYCTHKQWGAERGSRILKSRAQGEPFDAVFEDLGAEEESENAGIEEHEGDTTFAVDDDGMEYTMDDSTVGNVLTPGDAPTGISEAEAGRPYDMWPDESGQLLTMHGALLPVGYQLDTTIPDRPWACPVRTCRKAHCKRSDLGFHFQRVHFAAIMNDNCDGTFSIKSVYRSKDGMGKGGKILIKAPPIVVSKMPLKNGSPVPKAQLPAYLVSRSTMEGFEVPEITPTQTRSTRRRITDGSGAAELWAYIQPHLITTTTMPKAPVIRHLLAVPRQRDLQYNLRGTRFYEMGFRDIAAMLIQVTGDVPPDSCTRCRKGKGPFQGCVVMPQSAHLEARERYPCCANCVYGGKKSQCSLVKWVQEKTQWVEEGGDQFSPAREALPAPEPSSRVEETQPVSRYHRDLPLKGPRRQQPNPQLTGSPAAAPSQPGPSALISQGTFHGQDDLLEMEDWEVAPGRIREAVAADADTIAFSKPYLSTAAQAVPVCDDVAFRVDTVFAGNALQLEADAGKTRLCAVAAGKVRVKIGEEAEFVVGPHGMFKVKAGVACTVRNGLYLDAVLHTTVLVGFS